MSDDKPRYVTTGELADKLETLRWQIVAALLGGQTVAAIVAAFITRTTPAEASRTALDFFSSLL